MTRKPLIIEITAQITAKKLIWADDIETHEDIYHNEDSRLVDDLTDQMEALLDDTKAEDMVESGAMYFTVRVQPAEYLEVTGPDALEPDTLVLDVLPDELPADTDATPEPPAVRGLLDTPPDPELEARFAEILREAAKAERETKEEDK